MLDFTKIVRPYFRRFDRQMLRAASDPEKSQRETLASLLSEGSRTDWGRRYGFAPGLSYEQWRERCPMVDYEAIRQDVMRMVSGEADVLWPGVTRRYAQSSGTSGGKSKYIPITRRGLASSHYRGGTDVVARYLSLYPDSRLMSGRALILGGSMATQLPHPPGVKAGDLSAHLIECINPLAGLLRVPGKDVALMEDWHEKLPRLVADVARRDVTNLSGVPSWMLTVLKEVLKLTGASTISEVWPRLEVFFHGGIAFGPYREEYRRIIGTESMRYLETYNASEGFFGVQLDPSSPAMLLLMDVDTFYELIPLGGSPEDAIPAWEAKPGKVYELVITSSNGLWRYRIGDTIHIHSTAPLTFTIAGRTQQYINAFGEELMVHNAEAAFARACAATGASAANFTAAPVYPTPSTRGRHEWLIEWTTPPADAEAFAEALDRALRDENSDYDAKRSGGIFLDRLTIIPLAPGTFDRWLASTGKLGGQRKVPRLCPDRRYIDPIKSFATE
ncbi:MAG: GH3 auxin-responsive promoter family protein [Muribaculaceae bacterium]|nr:GH3 auxin-responsive promoter family protein [Muribaculaceae bacterium]